MWVDRDGKEEALQTPPGNYKTPRISPDGKMVALSKSADGARQIWIWDLARETMTRLTFDKSEDVRPIWTRDGKRIVYFSIRDGKYSINWKAADGTEEVQKLGSAPEVNLLPYSWSRDGKILAIEEMNSAMTHVDIGILSMEGDHARRLLLREEYSQGHPNISPDGQYMAYFSGESGRNEIYVRPFSEVNKGKWQISTGGGESPIWSPDGRELFYRNGGAVMAVPVDAKTTLNAGKPRMLFQGMYVTGYGESPAWDVSPDGKRFLMIKAPQLSSAGISRKINIVLNWTEELKQRVPIK
jgi:Tol biopolymer transport system component